MEKPSLEELQNQLAELKEKQNALQKEFIQLKSTNPGKTAIDAKLEEMKNAKTKVTEKEAELSRLYPDAKAEAKAKATATKGKKGQEDKTPKSGEHFGNLQLNQSRDRPGRTWARIRDFSAALDGQNVWLRARVHSVRATGAKLAFLVLRQRSFTIQAVLNEGPQIPRPMIKFAASIPVESLVNIGGVIVKTSAPIDSCTQKDAEIRVSEIWVESVAEEGPIRIEDCSRPYPLIRAQKAELAKFTKTINELREQIKALGNPEQVKALEQKIEELVAQKGAATKYVWPNQKTRLDNRILELRTQANQAIFTIQSGVCALFREFLLSQGFTEIHSPKLLAGASEGGAEVFKLKYFNENACLAQSPQFYKQMAVCGDIERVFEIGPVFRAENAFTHRHLCEFVGLDLEMAINEHYHEVLDVLDSLFLFIFEGIETRFARELEVINTQFPFPKLQYKRPSPRILFKDGVAMLREEEKNIRAALEKATTEEEKEELNVKLKDALGKKGAIGDYEDLSTPQEKLLGRLVKAKYGVDFYILDRFPTEVRPFYTMISPDDPKYTNSYDLFIRTEEICSGSQRVHSSDVLTKRAEEKNIPLATIRDYINSFRYGAPPHGGGGIGLERVVMLYLGLSNIRKSSLFPRDPARLTP